MVIIKQRLKEARDRQKSYVDASCRDRSCEVGNMVLVWVRPMKCPFKFARVAKLAPIFVGPFKVLKRIGSITY